MTANNTPAVAKKKSALTELKMFLGAKDEIVEQRFFATMFRLMKSPDLMNCTKSSLMHAARNLAVLGLDPDPTMKLVYIIPFRNVATVITDYRGLIELARQTGDVIDVNWGLIREKDKFEYCETDAGTHFIHERDINLTAEQRGKIIGAWSRWWIAGAIKPHIHVTGHEETMAAKEKSSAVKSGKKDSPWLNDNEEGWMWLKTNIRSAHKLLPKTSRRLNAAIHAEDQAELGQQQDVANYAFEDAEDIDFTTLSDEFFEEHGKTMSKDDKGENFGKKNGQSVGDKQPEQKDKEQPFTLEFVNTPAAIKKCKTMEELQPIIDFIQSTDTGWDLAQLAEAKKLIKEQSEKLKRLSK